MKKRFNILLLLLIIVVGSAFLLTSCGGNSTSKPKSGEANTVESNSDVTYEAKYYTDGGFINLEGNAPEAMEIVGYQGDVKELNLKKIEDKVKINGKKINVVSIGYFSFGACNTLETVDLTKKDMTDEFNIGDYAFDYCKNLTTVVLPNNLYSNGNKIGNYAFDRCIKLNSITGLDQFTIIGDSAFDSCIALTSITLSNDIKVIPNYCFLNSINLATVKMGTKIESIGKNAFSNTKVKDIDFKAMTNLKTISDNAFYNANLTKVELPDSIRSIGDSAFVNNELTTVDVPFIASLDDTTTKYNSIYGFDEDYILYKKTIKPSEIGEDILSHLPKTAVKVRKSNQLTNDNFDNSSYDFLSNIVSVDLTYAPNGMYDFDFDGESTDKIEIPEEELNINPMMYDGQLNLTTFKVNGVEKYDPDSIMG